jgi:hypothetical protein
MVTELARVLVNNRRDQRIDDTACRRGAARPGGILKAGREVQRLALLKPLDPVINRSPPNLTTFGDRSNGFAGGQPEQGLDTAKFPCKRRSLEKRFQLPALGVSQFNGGHGLTLETVCGAPGLIVFVQELLVTYLDKFGVERLLPPTKEETSKP